MNDPQQKAAFQRILDLGVVFQPLKPFYFGFEEIVRKDGSKILVPVQHKYSEYPIIPELLPIRNTKDSEKVNSGEQTDSTSTSKAAVYEKSETKTKSVGYSRPSVVEQLKADAEARQKQLASIVEKSLSKQAGLYSQANGDDIWRFLASGNVKVDSATSLQAQKDIGEDGYWGVKQTSQRLFDFASALAGDDVDKMKEMQKAMEKGFKLATGAWGKKLPSICSETMDAANKLFEDYYASKSSE
jgi:hypothetical protein